MPKKRFLHRNFLSKKNNQYQGCEKKIGKEEKNLCRQFRKNIKNQFTLNDHEEMKSNDHIKRF